MLVKNNIAQPGEIKSIDLQPNHIEVRKRTGEVLHYERQVPQTPAQIMRRVDPPREGDN